MSHIGVVAIGRNEGDRLHRCLSSLRQLLPEGVPIVYVDSGSTDNSVEIAQALDVHVIQLDPSTPFTMARGRNTGFAYLTHCFSDMQYVQFIDGDCELLPGWLEQAVTALESDEKLAIVCGRRHERFPEASPYNRLADMEWNTPIGEAEACGGDILARVAAIQEVRGYNEELICGEEPEMCIRLRERGWKIRRIDASMTLHDAAMLHFSQWWKRSIREGWGVAEGAAMYGASPERYKYKDQLSGIFWGLVLPAFALGFARYSSGLSLLLLLGYPLLLLKIYRYRKSYGDEVSHAWLYAFFCVLSKFPQIIGQIQYWIKRYQGKPATLIEYKTANEGVKY